MAKKNSRRRRRNTVVDGARADDADDGGGARGDAGAGGGAGAAGGGAGGAVMRIPDDVISQVSDYLRRHAGRMSYNALKNDNNRGCFIIQGHLADIANGIFRQVLYVSEDIIFSDALDDELSQMLHNTKTFVKENDNTKNVIVMLSVIFSTSKKRVKGEDDTAIMTINFPLSANIVTAADRLAEDIDTLSSAMEDLLVDIRAPMSYDVLGSVTRCSVCHEVSSHIKRCSICEMVFYCSGDCQRLDWHRHKKLCASLKAVRQTMLKKNKE